MELIQENFPAGIRHEFDNEQYFLACLFDQTTDDTEPDIHSGWAGKVSHSWGDYYIIWFNGTVIYNAKTFSSFKTRLIELFDRWNLNFIDHA